jgi:hypothetical protein
MENEANFSLKGRLQTEQALESKCHGPYRNEPIRNHGTECHLHSYFTQVKEIEEVFIDENLRLRISENSWVIIHGSNYGFLAVGVLCIGFSWPIFYMYIANSKWDQALWPILVIAPLSLFTFGLQRWVEINTVNKRVVKKLCLFNKLKVKLYQRTYGENIFLIKEVGISDDTIQKLYLQGELAPVFLFTFNSEKTAENFYGFIERYEVGFMVKEI